MSLKPFACLLVYLSVMNDNQIEANQNYDAYHAYEVEYLWRPFGRAHNLMRSGSHAKSETSHVNPTPPIVSEPNKYENKYMDNADDLQKQLDTERKQRNKHLK